MKNTAGGALPRLLSLVSLARPSGVAFFLKFIYILFVEFRNFWYNIKDEESSSNKQVARF